MRRVNLSIIFSLLISISGLFSSANAQEQKINLQALLSKGEPILLEFGRGWCVPCKYMKPILDDMGQSYAGKAIVATVDMDANKALVRDFRIRMMPTQVFIAPDGKEFFRNEGTLERDAIVRVFTEMGVVPPNLKSSAPVPIPNSR